MFLNEYVTQIRFEKGFPSSYTHLKYRMRNVGFCLPCLLLASEFRTAYGCLATSWDLMQVTEGNLVKNDSEVIESGFWERKKAKQ